MMRFPFKQIEHINFTSIHRISRKRERERINRTDEDNGTWKSASADGYWKQKNASGGETDGGRDIMF